MQVIFDSGIEGTFPRTPLWGKLPSGTPLSIDELLSGIASFSEISDCCLFPGIKLRGFTPEGHHIGQARRKVVGCVSHRVCTMANPAMLVFLALALAGVSDSMCDSGYFRSAKDVSSDYSAAARIFSYNLNGTSDSQIKTPFGELLVRFSFFFNCHMYL